MRPRLGVLVPLLLAGCVDTAVIETQKAGMLAYHDGYAALQEGDYAKAAEQLAIARQDLPDDPYAALDLGVAYQHLGRLEEARAAYRRAIELGKQVQPRNVTDPRYAGRTVAQLAQDDLDGMALKK